jgi:hypothetical protein
VFLVMASKNTAQYAPVAGAIENMNWAILIVAAVGVLDL